MAYRFKAGENAEKGIRRIIAEQIKKALDELNDTDSELTEVIHQLRKRCKKIRAVLRLTRSVARSAYIMENARYRNIAGMIATMRDSQAAVETYEVLAAHFKGKIDQRTIRPVYSYLLKRRNTIMSEVTRNSGALNNIRHILDEGRSHAEEMNFRNGAASIETGIRDTFLKARKAMKNAYIKRSAEAFHEWRKHTKYHYYHMILLSNLKNSSGSGRKLKLEELEEELGLHHNLHILRLLIKETPEFTNGRNSFHVLYNAAGQWMREIKEKSRKSGDDLFSKKRPYKNICDFIT